MALRILLVEFNEADAYIFSEFLTEHGHFIKVVGDCAAMVKACEESSFDLILTDLSLPDSDGISLVKQPKKECAFKVDVPMVALTSCGNQIMFSGITTRCKVFELTKPFTMPNLLQVVNFYARQLETNSVQSVVSPAVDVSSGDRLNFTFEKILDMDVVDSVFRGKQSNKIVKMLEFFQADLSRNRQKITTATETSDKLLVQAACHALYGSASLVGAHRLATLARRVEFILRDGTELNWSECDSIRAIIDLTAAAINDCQEKLRAAD
jgi:two-component system, NarL family, sensor histidine kinase BarA